MRATAFSVSTFKADKGQLEATLKPVLFSGTAANRVSFAGAIGHGLDEEMTDEMTFKRSWR